MLSAKKIFGFIFLLLFLIIFPSTAEAANTSKKATSSAAPVVSPAPLPQLTASQSASLSAMINQEIKEPTSPFYANIIIANIFHSFGCIAIGTSLLGLPCVEYIGMVDEGGRIKSVPVISNANLSGGVWSGVNSMIFALYNNKPIGTAEYLAYMGQNFGIVNEAHAQVGGSGSGVLSPVFALWRVSRNIAYAFMIIVFVVIGIMVMLRNKINPQTVISIQAALPSLILGLIMITFSYFLASLITDLAFVGTNLVGYYFLWAQGVTQDFNTVQTFTNENVITIMSRFLSEMTGQNAWNEFTKASALVIDNLNTFPQAIVRTVVAIMAYQYGSAVGGAVGAAGAAIACGLGGTAILGFLTAGIGAGAGLGAAAICAPLGNFVGGVAAGGVVGGWALTNTPSAIGFAVTGIALFVLLYTMVRLLFTLTTNFLAIIFYTITAPFYFLLASLPGRESLATDWMRNMLCNVLAFPAVFTVFYFVSFLVPIRDFRPPAATAITVTGQQTLPLFGGIDTSVVNLILAFGALIATPAIPEIICRAIGKVGPAGQLIGGEIRGSTASGRGYANQTNSNIGYVEKEFLNRRDQLRGREQYPTGLAGKFELFKAFKRPSNSK